MALNYSRLGGSNATFQSMIQRFGVVTVMNADVYEGPDAATLEAWKTKSAKTILSEVTGNSALAHLDTLKIANVPQEGPSKTVTGGQYSNPLIKFGKSARLEVQDALGNARALDTLTGTVSEGSVAYNSSSFYANIEALHVTEDFQGPKTIIGDSFFIDQKTGNQVPVKIVFYQFLPDSIFNLNQDAEGDATVFDMNGDLLTTNIGVKDQNGDIHAHGVFYSIVDPSDATSVYSYNTTTGVITLEAGYTAKLDGATVTSGTTAVDAGKAALLVVKDSNDNTVAEDVLIGPAA